MTTITSVTTVAALFGNSLPVAGNNPAQSLNLTQIQFSAQEMTSDYIEITVNGNSVIVKNPNK